jgi:hypothetical protein
VNPQPALGIHPSQYPPTTARERAEKRWAHTRRRPHSVASKVADAQLYGLGTATAAVLFTRATWWSIALVVAAYVGPALIGAWIATRRPRPAYRSALVELTLDRKERS